MKCFTLEAIIDGEKFTLMDDEIFVGITLYRANYNFPIYQQELENMGSNDPDVSEELAKYGEQYKKMLDKFLKLRAFL